jgi:hypothetical protein
MFRKVSNLIQRFLKDDIFYRIISNFMVFWI